MRYLAFVSAFFSLAIFISAYLLPVNACFILSFAFLATACFLLFYKKKINKRKLYLIAVMAAFSLSAGFAAYSVYYSQTVTKAESVSGIDSSYSAVVISYPQIWDDYSRVLVQLKNSDAIGLKSYLYFYSGDISSLEPGMELKFSASLNSVSSLDADNIDSLLSNGIYLKGKVQSTAVRINTSRISALRFYPQKISKYLSSVIDSAFSKKSSPFFKSLLLGDKNELYNAGTNYTALSRAGFSHIVAVSGMHVAFVVGFIQNILGKKRRYTALFCILSLWFFIILTGSSPSSVRAGIMQTVLLVSFLCYRDNDVLTSLSFALAIILLLNPFSAKSVSLQLSFGATLGICLFGPVINNVMSFTIKNDIFNKIVSYAISTLINSISVVAFTIPIAALNFGFISVVAPLTNILALWTVPICFIGTVVVFLLYFVYPTVGIFAAKLLSYLSDYIFYICRLTSSIPCSVIYTDTVPAILMLISLYAVVALIIFARENQLSKFILCFACYFLITAVYNSFSFLDSRSQDATVTAIDIGQGQCICVNSGKNTVLIDCGSSSLSADAGVTAADYLKSHYINKVDALVFTHLHEDHANGALSLLELTDVSSILIPDYRNRDDALFDAITDYALHNAIKVYIICQPCEYSAGNIQLKMYPAELSDMDLNESCMIVSACIDDFDVIITGDCPYEREERFANSQEIDHIESIIVGHHGSAGSSSSEYLKLVSPDYAIISVGAGNMYGHPSDKVLRRLADLQISFYRTDINGCVSLNYNE